MIKRKVRNIYYINRYDLHKPNKVRDYSGYEQVAKYSNSFKRINPNKRLSKILFFFFKKYTPLNYLQQNYSKELIAFFKALVTGNPIFYLYADKDAFLVPILKRKLGLKRIKIFGTLHWPIETSKKFSFHKFNLASEFNGIIALSSSLKQLGIKNLEVIPHGINLDFWNNEQPENQSNMYLIIGISNRNHEQQIHIINEIKNIDNKAKFILVARNKKVISYYQNISNLEIRNTYVLDEDLKLLYMQAKAVILIQNHCYASNVVLESMAMQVPLITNRIGDIEEYLGNDYVLYINEDNLEEKLKHFCFSNDFRSQIVNYFEQLRRNFNWNHIVKRDFYIFRIYK